MEGLVVSDAAEFRGVLPARRRKVEEVDFSEGRGKDTQRGEATPQEGRPFAGDVVRLAHRMPYCGSDPFLFFRLWLRDVFTLRK